jgi:hypothetical protein
MAGQEELGMIDRVGSGELSAEALAAAHLAH